MKRPWNPLWQTAAGMRTYLDSVGVMSHSLGKPSTNQELWFIETGGFETPPIMLTAGSHADEIAGVWAALELAETIETSRKVFVVPVRDPVGWNGFRAALRGAGVDVSDDVKPNDVEALVRASGTPIWEDDEAGIYIVGGHAFALVAYAEWPSTRLVRHILPEVVAADTRVRRSLSGRYVVVPGNVGGDTTRDAYAWGGHTAYISSSGYAAHLNRFFDRNDSPVEVKLLRDFVDANKPGLVIDLHEGFTDKFYAFSTEDAASLNVSKALVAAAIRAGAETPRRDQLEPTWGPLVSKGIRELGRGVFSLSEAQSSSRASFAGYCAEFAASVTTESGMLAPPETRANWILAGAHGAIDAWERTVAK